MIREPKEPNDKTVPDVFNLRVLYPVSVLDFIRPDGLRDSADATGKKLLAKVDL